MKIKNKVILAITVLTLFIASMSMTALAADGVKPSSIKITNSTSDRSLSKDKEMQLQYVIKPNDADTETEVTWSSSDSYVVDVDGNGNVTALNPGVATVKVSTANGKSASVNFTVPGKKDDGTTVTYDSANKTTTISDGTILKTAETKNQETIDGAKKPATPASVTTTPAVTTAKPTTPAATSADADIQRITAMFTKKFSNEIKVVKIAQQETNYKLKNAVKTPVVYTYDIENNKYYPVAKTLYKVNEDSSISFDKSVSGCLVLSVGELAKK